MNKTELIEHIAKQADISKAAATRATWDDLSAAGALASAAHTAYHLGAIRQILAALDLAAADQPRN